MFLILDDVILRTYSSYAISFTLCCLPALLDSLGGLWRDVHGADGLSVGVEGGAGVLSLISRSNRLDHQGNLEKLSMYIVMYLQSY